MFDSSMFVDTARQVSASSTAGSQPTQGGMMLGSRKNCMATVTEPDGRICALCPITRRDTDPDLVITNNSMKWGMNKGKKSDGRVCFYCRRVWRARWGKTYDLPVFINTCADQQELYSKFCKLVKFVVDKMIAAGKYEIIIKWSDFGEDANDTTNGEQASDKRLVTHNKRSVEVAQDPDEILFLEDYKKEHGDPKTNGHAHKEIKFRGKQAVVIPGAKRFKVHRRESVEVDLEEVINDGNMVLEEGQLEMQLDEIGAALFPLHATGTTLDSLLGSSRASPATPPRAGSSSQSSSSAAGFAGGSASSGAFGAFGALFGIEDSVPAPAVKTEPMESPGKTAGQAKAKGCKRTAPSVPQASKAHDDSSPAKLPGGRGRPPRDLFVVATIALAGFKEVGVDDSKHFGDASRTYRRWVERQLKDMDALLSKMDREDKTVKEKKIIRKGLNMMNEIMRIAPQGTRTPAFVQAYDEQSAFLRLEPVTEDPCPLWLQSIRIEVKAESCSPDASFWQLIRADALGPVCADDDSRCKMQTRMVAQKIILITQREQDCHQVLKDFVAETSMKDATIDNEEVQSQASTIRAITMYESVLCNRAALAPLTSAVKEVCSAKDKPDSTLAVLTMFPAGQKLLQAAEAREKEISQGLEVAAKSHEAFQATVTAWVAISSTIVDAEATVDVKPFVECLDALEKQVSGQPVTTFDALAQASGAKELVAMVSSLVVQIETLGEAFAQDPCDLKAWFALPTVVQMRQVLEAFSQCVALASVLRLCEPPMDIALQLKLPTTALVTYAKGVEEYDAKEAKVVNDDWGNQLAKSLAQAVQHDTHEGMLFKKEGFDTWLTIIGEDICQDECCKSVRTHLNGRCTDKFGAQKLIDTVKSFLQPASEHCEEIDEVAFDKLEGFAREVDDLVFADQVHAMKVIAKVGVHVYIVLKWWQESASREHRCISEDKTALLLKLRSRVADLNVLVNQNNGQRLPFVLSPTASSPCHVDLLDAVFSADTIQQMLNFGRRVQTDIQAHWVQDIRELQSSVSSWCPPWQAAADGLLENKQLMEDLLKNKKYPELGKASSLLGEMHGLIVEAQSDGLVRFAEAQLMKDASSTSELGKLTVCLTFTLFVVMAQIPRAASNAAKQGAAIKANELIKEKLDMKERLRLPACLLRKLDAHLPEAQKSKAAAA